MISIVVELILYLNVFILQIAILYKVKQSLPSTKSTPILEVLKAINDSLFE